MNLELIQEIRDLKSNDLSYTQIADTIGTSKSSVALSLRLSTLFENHYTSQVSSLQSTVDQLNSSLSSKELEIKRLNTLIAVDDERDMLITKETYKNLKYELAQSKERSDSLNRQLRVNENYLNNLSYTDKLKLLFQ